MANLNHVVDPTQVDENSFEVLPAGDYPVIIESSEMKPTKDGTGQYLKLVYQVIDGPKKGAKLFNNLNLVNKNQQAVEIAKKSLNAIGVCLGLNQIQDSALLHNQPMIVSVGVKPDERGEPYGDKNFIKKHSPFNGNGSTQNPSAPQQQGTVAKWAR